MSGPLHPRSRRLAAALLPALLVAALTLRAAPGPAEFTVREWHEDDGLPAESVNQVHQDRRGRLWVSTASGLSRFDGTVFTPVAAPAGDESGPQPIQFLAENQDGLLLVPRAGDPVVLRDGEYRAAPLPAPWTGRAVLAFLQEAEGVHWYALRGGVVLRVARDGVKAFEGKDGISTRDITRFALDGRGRVWVTSDGFLGRYENGKILPVVLGTPPSELRIVSNRHGSPWIITADRVLAIASDDRAEEVVTVPTLIGAHYVAAACSDASGALWLGTRSQGVHRATPGRLEHIPTSSEDVRTVYEDADGNIWVGTNTGGLNAIGPRFHQLRDKNSGLKSNACFAVCVDDAGDLWYANGDGGVARERAGEILPVELRIPAGTFGAISVSPARGGGVWVAGSPGLFRVRLDDREPVQRIAGVPATGVRRVMLTARNGDLWLSVDPDRLGRWRDPEFKLFGPSEGFDGFEVRTIVEDPAGNLWVSTRDGRLFRQEGERFTRVPLGVARPTGDIYTIHFSPDGRVWLGTRLAGILVLPDPRFSTESAATTASAGATTSAESAKTPSARRETIVLNAACGLPGDTVTQFAPDNDGNLWCGSERGVFRLEREELRRFLEGEQPWLNPLRLGRDDGVPRVSCSGLYGPGATKSADGRIWFATRQGILLVDPAAAKRPVRAPVVEIDEVRCDERVQPAGRAFQPGPDTRKLEFRFSVLSLSAPARVQARYRLDGFDDEWILAGAERVATYPRLPPGNYTFRVSTGFGETGAENGQAAALSFVVPPHWWQEWWFRATVVLASIVAVALAARAWSHRRWRRKVEDLERRSALERERSRIAQNIHDDVGASLTRISLLTQAISPGQPPKPETLEQIFETTREIARSLDETVWAVNPRYDTLEGFAGYMADYTQRYLVVANIRCRLDVPARLTDTPFGSHVRHQLFLCVREALNNVVKHAGANEVTFRIAVAGEQVEVVITDNGRGLDVARRESPARVAGGNGLNNMQRRMASLGGVCLVESPAAANSAASGGSTASAAGASAGAGVGIGGVAPASDASNFRFGTSVTLRVALHAAPPSFENS